MEQTTQQTIQKPPLPIKTKVGAWWMIVIGGVIILFGLFLLLLANAQKGYGASGVGFTFGISGCLLGLLIGILPGCSLLQRKKRGWWWSIILLFIGIGVFGYMIIIYEPELTGYLLFLILILLPPFVLLLLDRKNFWKIAT
jgi:peptidoglycan/LPS O-acetylase OafA/YrhL